MSVSVELILSEATRQLSQQNGQSDEREELCLLDNRFNKIGDNIPKGIRHSQCICLLLCFVHYRY